MGRACRIVDVIGHDDRGPASTIPGLQVSIQQPPSQAIIYLHDAARIRIDLSTSLGAWPMFNVVHSTNGSVGQHPYVNLHQFRSATASKILDRIAVLEKKIFPKSLALSAGLHTCTADVQPSIDTVL